MRDDQLGPVATVVAELPAGGLGGRRLRALREAILTEAEFEAEKARILQG